MIINTIFKQIELNMNIMYLKHYLDKQNEGIFILSMQSVALYSSFRTIYHIYCMLALLTFPVQAFKNYKYQPCSKEPQGSASFKQSQTKRVYPILNEVQK